MPHPEHLRIARAGAEAIAEWRRKNANVTLALSRAKLYDADLIGANLSGADLSKAALKGANLSRANLSGATLSGADLGGSIMGSTILGGLDLSSAIGLDSVRHLGPSTVGIDSVIKSRGAIPEIFLRGCGVPDIFIQYIGSLTHSPIQYYSCFISYSTKDEDFAKRIHSDLQAKGVRCWFAPHDIQSGKKIHEQIDEAIRLYDKLLLILSPESMASNWVRSEIERARAREVQQNRKMLFPVRLMSFDQLQEWTLFDADIGRDTAKEIREYYVPDFSQWKFNHDGYAAEFEKLMRDLKAETSRKN